MAANDLTDAQLDELRSALDRPEACDEEVRACVLRLNLSGWRLVNGPQLDAELARVLRMATHTLASEMQAIARNFDAADDTTLLIGAAHARDELLTKWLEDR